MKINFWEMKLTNLASTTISNVSETIGDIVWALATTPKMKFIAEKIYKKEDVEITGIDKDEIIGYLKDQRSWLLPFRAREVEYFIDNYGKSEEKKGK